MSQETKVKLSSEDWTNLIPTKTVPIASKSVTVKPFGFAKLTETIRKFKAVQNQLTEMGVTLANYNEPENLLSITLVILERMPELILDSSNLDPEDIKEIPVNIALTLVEAMLDANIESQKGFLKNLTALASKASLLVGTQE